MVEYLSRTIRGFYRLKKLCWFSTCMTIMIILLIAWVVFQFNDTFEFHVEKLLYLYSLPALLIILIILLNISYLNERRKSIHILLHETKQMYDKQLDSLYESIRDYSDLRNTLLHVKTKKILERKKLISSNLQKMEKIGYQDELNS